MSLTKHCRSPRGGRRGDVCGDQAGRVIQRHAGRSDASDECTGSRPAAQSAAASIPPSTPARSGFSDRRQGQVVGLEGAMPEGMRPGVVAAAVLGGLREKISFVP